MTIRRIKSEKEILAKQKSMQWIVGIIMASLLLLSTVGYFASEMFGSNSEVTSSSIVYNGNTYSKQGELLTLVVEGKPFYFYNLPNESKNIYLNASSFTDYSGKPLYIVNMSSAAQLVLMNLEGTYLRWQTACLEKECEENLPVKNCSDNLIVFVADENTKVERKENCIFISGDFERGVDAFSYKLLEIK